MIEKTFSNPMLRRLLEDLEREGDEQEWFNEDIHITISRHVDTKDFVAEVVIIPKNRIVVSLDVEYRDGEGNRRKQGFHSHIITLANEEALQRMWDAVSDGVVPWNDVLEQKDVLVWEDDLDS